MGADFDATFAIASSIHIPRRAHDAYEDKKQNDTQRNERTKDTRLVLLSRGGYHDGLLRDARNLKGGCIR